MKTLRHILTAGTFGAIAASVTPAPVAAYPIDCAILLCLAGGFPASAECTAAKAEMIRRITPYPIEPPLQLWRCPMGLSADVAQAIGMTAIAFGPDGLTPEVRQYRDAIEIYDVLYRFHRNGGDELYTDSTREGDYHDTSGAFFWKGSSYEDGPDWLAEAVGGYRLAIHDTSKGWQQKIIGYRNQAKRKSIRAIAMRFLDWQGNYHAEVVHY